MANSGINFAQQTNLYKEKERKEVLFKGVIVAVAILILTVLAYGGVFAYKVSQKLELSKVENQITHEQGIRNYNELTEALDTASRLNFASEMSRRQILWSGILQEIQSKMLPSVHVTKIEGATDFTINMDQSQIPAMPAVLQQTQMDLNKVKVEIVSQNLSDISKQIVAFSDSNRFQDVLLGTSSGSGAKLDEEGVLVMLQLNLADHALERGTFPIETPTDVSSVPDSSVLPEEEALPNN